MNLSPEQVRKLKSAIMDSLVETMRKGSAARLPHGAMPMADVENPQEEAAPGEEADMPMPHNALIVKASGKPAEELHKRLARVLNKKG